MRFIIIHHFIPELPNFAFANGLFCKLPDVLTMTLALQGTIFPINSLPNKEVHEEYQFYVDQYVATYPQMRDLMHTMADHVAKQS